MNIFSLITGHTHYWGLPHLSETDNRLIQICYECGAHRTVKARLVPDTLQHGGSASAPTAIPVDVKRAA